jgi:HlyD family secretion protein
MRYTARNIVLVVSVVPLAAASWLVFTRHGPLAPVQVQTARVVRANVSPTVFGIGVVEARLAYSIGPTSPGRLQRVLVDHGDNVKAGQLLAEMEPVDLERRVQAAENARMRSRQGVRVAEAVVQEATVRTALAAVNRDRELDLHRQKLTTQLLVDSRSGEAAVAEAALAAAQANAEAARQDVGRMDAEARAVRGLRDNLRLLSPADGIVVSRDAEPGSTVVAGQAVLRIVAPHSLWVRARVDQSRARGVEVGQAASIVLRSAPDLVLAGRVARVELQGDPVTEERVVDVSFDPQPEQLFLGELAEVTIHLPNDDNVLVVPTAAVSRNGGQAGIWQDVGQRARFKPVRVHAVGEPGLSRATSGLEEGESIIVYSTAGLTEGARVREREVTP